MGDKIDDDSNCCYLRCPCSFNWATDPTIIDAIWYWTQVLVNFYFSTSIFIEIYSIKPSQEIKVNFCCWEYDFKEDEDYTYQETCLDSFQISPNLLKLLSNQRKWK